MAEASEGASNPRIFDEFHPDDVRRALDAGGIGAWQWDLVSGRMLLSRQMFRNLGLDPMHCGDLYEALLSATHPQDREEAAAQFAALRRRVGPLRIELRALWPDGEAHWIVFLGEVEADAAGRPALMRGITIDGTRRRAAEEAAEAALRESERRLRDVNERLEDLAERRARQLDASRAQMQAILDNSPD